MRRRSVEALRGFRAGLYACFSRRPDALFELAEALLATQPVASLPYLSLSAGARTAATPVAPAGSWWGVPGASWRVSGASAALGGGAPRSTGDGGSPGMAG